MPKIESPEELGKKCAERKAERKTQLGRSMTWTGNPVGRPQGGNLMQKMMNEAAPEDVEKVVEALMTVCLDPSHRSWPQAIKIFLDRAAHISHFVNDGESREPVVSVKIIT